ncbi:MULTISPECIES: hypothetical protein [unclassified Micromonospora]|uniref:hypothetical protein n=1 Tax=unclassified Micromonospora TaxID=2617518 RepID=UPI002FF0CCD8
MHRIRTLLGVLAAVAGVTAVVPAAAQAAPTAPYTALVVDDTQVGGDDTGSWDGSRAR